jgi:uncharacterized protein (TIRG00374 family)
MLKTETQKNFPIESDGERESYVPYISIKDRLLDVKTLLGFGISAAIIIFFVLTVKIDFAVTFDNILRANLLWLVLAFVVYYMTFVFRGIRWRMLLVNAKFDQEHGVKLPPLPGLIEIIFLSWFVNCIVPAKLGDAYRGYLLKKNANASFSLTLGTIFGERIADLLVLFSLMCFGGALAFSRVESKFGSLSLLFLFGGILVLIMAVGLVVLRFYSHKVEKIVPKRMRGIYQKFQQGTVSTFHRRTLIKLYGLTGVIWLLEGARLFFVLQALGVTGLGISVTVFVALASSLLTTLPFTPAGLGAVEGAVVGVLTAFSVEKNLAASVAILDRVVNYWSLILFGAIVYIFSRKK